MHQGEFAQAKPQAPLKGLAGVAVLDGVQPFHAELSFPRGEAGAFSGSSEPMKVTEEGWRQPKYCLHFVQWYQLKVTTPWLPPGGSWQPVRAD